VTRFFVLVLVSALVLGLPPGVTTAAPDNVIRFGAAVDDNALPLLYAQHAGIYQKYGVTVEITKFSNGAAASAALAGGSLDMSKNSTLGVITAISRGLPFTIVGSIGHYNANRPDYALVVGTTSNVKTAADLAGKTLATISLQDMSSRVTVAWMKSHGVDPGTVQYVELPAVATLAAIEEGRAVGATMSEPFLSAALATGNVRILGYPYSVLGDSYDLSVLFAAKPWATAHQDLVKRFLRATQEASVYVGEHEDTPEMHELIGTFTGVDPATIKKTRHPGRGVTLNSNDLQTVIDFAANANLIAKAYPAKDAICSCAIAR
jgi:NitT/TauT family transport system substrate-binding protein